MSYNFKVWNFGNGKKQIRIYNNSVRTDFKREKEEIEEEDLDFNPFTEKYEKMVEYKEVDEERVREVSNNRAKQKIYELARSNEWEYFLTLTFAEDRYNYELLTKKLSKWINNIKRDYAPEMKYIFVPELHKDGALHFHGIVANIGNLPLIDSGYKDRNDNIIFNINAYKMGFTTATQVTDSGRVASYMTKYITKDLCSYSKGKKKYWSSRNLLKPNITDYHITDEEIKDFMCRNTDLITFAKTIDNPLGNTKIQILEIDENIG